MDNNCTRKTGRNLDNTIKELKEKLDSMDSPEQREQYLLGLRHGHDWFMETLQRGLKLGLSEGNLKRFLLSEITAQKIYWRSVRDRI